MDTLGRERHLDKERKREMKERRRLTTVADAAPIYPSQMVEE